MLTARNFNNICYSNNLEAHKLDSLKDRKLQSAMEVALPTKVAITGPQERLIPTK